MSSDGRTLWYPQDARWLSWDAVIELGGEFGPAAVAVLVQITSEAKLQGPGWTVKVGLRTVARDSFVGDLEVARRVIERSAEVGLLDDVEFSGRTVTCRISGMAASERKARDSARKAELRASADRCGQVRTDADNVDESADIGPTGEDSRGEEFSVGVRGAVDAIWTAYVETRSTVIANGPPPKLNRARRDLIARRLSEWPAADLDAAVRGWRHFPHNRGENDRGRPFCSIELILRDADHIETFRDAERKVGVISSAEYAERFNAAQGSA